MRRKRVVIYSQSLVGLGHVVRGVALAEALSGTYDVLLITGGTADLDLAPSGLYRRVQLIPMRLSSVQGLAHPLYLDESLSCLETLHPQMSTSDAINARKRRIMREILDFEPDLVITEFFPLGRWAFGMELLPAIRHARKSGARVVCSVRDIIKPLDDDSVWRTRLGDEYEAGYRSYYKRAIKLLNSDFDALFVHSDESLISLAESVLGIEEISIPIRYTGFLSAELSIGVGAESYVHEPKKAVPRFVISAGGGYGECTFFREWVPALEKLRAQELGLSGIVVVLCGPLMEDHSYSELKEVYSACPTVLVKRYCNSFQTLLDGAALSVSRSGYNTAFNILRSKVPALVIPAGHHADQKIRARRFDLCRIAASCESDVTLEQRVARLSATLRSAAFIRDASTGGAQHTRKAVEAQLALKQELERPN